MLAKKGNSNSEEKIDLLYRFEEIFPNILAAYISGDREFVLKDDAKLRRVLSKSILTQKPPLVL